MAKGRLQQVGTPEQLLDRPRNMFVARFIGSPPMNLLHARLTSEGEDVLVETDGGRLPLSRDWQPALARYGKDDVVLGVRPDRLTIASNGAGEITATVDDVEALIGETSVDFRLPSGARLTGMFADDLDGLLPGSTARLSIAGDGIELFDPETELSLRAT
jgi:ABC-type sugar transport system ATPase subunit